MLRPKHIKLCEAIRDAGGQPYVVGGFVRDLVLGRDPHDVDIVVVGMPRDPLNHGYNGNRPRDYLTRILGVSDHGSSFPVFVKNGVEIALARTERKTDKGYTGFECEIANVTLEDDLRRRDLTMNAMAMDPFTNKIIDPFGGRMDIQNGVLRAVGPHFAEDPLRVLRVARFAAQLTYPREDGIGYNTPSLDEGLLALTQKVLHELPELSQERVFEELMKGLRSDYPSIFFSVLDHLGALEILFPELSALQGRVQPILHHSEGDAYVHTLMVIDRARALGADDETIFAALTHDYGKAVTPDDELPHHYNHEKLGVSLVHQACDRLKVPNTYRKTATLVARHHLNIHRFEELRPVKRVRLLVSLGALHDDTTLRRVALASQADAQGRGAPFVTAHHESYPQREKLLGAARVLRSVRGHQFAHLRDGRVISQKMEQARSKALEKAGFTRVKRKSINT